MPIVRGQFSGELEPSRSERRTSSPQKYHKKPRSSRPLYNTPSQEPEAQLRRLSTSSDGAYDGRLSPGETRQEWIERKKREQRATWLGHGVGPSSPPFTFDNIKASSGKSVPVLLPPARIEEPRQDQNQNKGHGFNEAASCIERPRSALHRGDFREELRSQDVDGLQAPGSSLTQVHDSHGMWLSGYSPALWCQPHLRGDSETPSLQENETFGGCELVSWPVAPPRTKRQRAASYTSRSLCLAFQPPTSPLVNETNNNSDSDNKHIRSGRLQSPDETARRRTFSPCSLRSIRPIPRSHDSSPVVPRALPNPPRGGTIPYQAHQPRRSVTYLNDQAPCPIPSTPSAHSRKPSLATGSSPLHRAPMIGRYEESILRGRMSSLPSRPLDFVAQIGVLGKGNCRSSLRCPPHVSIPFPAVFYNYGRRPTSPTKSEADPSPYVGMIDMSTADSRTKVEDGGTSGAETVNSNKTAQVQSEQPNKPQVRKRSRKSSNSSQINYMTPPGGYQIPEKGQLQIIIKNPNKTAVKLYLVPYDLEGMQPGQKTFIRQRSYSAGPIIDMPLIARKNFRADRPEAALTNPDDPKDQPMLRYLIHLNICCPAKGRFYLYRSLRVVFANRVPDGKEKLRQEMQLPEPRFSPWKPELEAMNPEHSKAKSPHRLSCGESPLTSTQSGFSMLDQMDGMSTSMSLGDNFNHRAFTFPIQNTNSLLKSPRISSRNYVGELRMQTPPSPPSPLSPQESQHHCRACAPLPSSHHLPVSPQFSRLTQEEFVGDCSSQRTRSLQPGEGLLALQFRDLSGSRPSSRNDERR